LLVLAQDITVQRGFLDPPAAADLNTRNLSALYEVVDSRERNPQVLGRLFYGKEMVNRTFGHSLRENSVVIVSPYKIGFYPANLRVFKKSGARVVAMPFQSVRFPANASTSPAATRFAIFWKMLPRCAHALADSPVGQLAWNYQIYGDAVSFDYILLIIDTRKESVSFHRAETTRADWIKQKILPVNEPVDVLRSDQVDACIINCLNLFVVADRH